MRESRMAIDDQVSSNPRSAAKVCALTGKVRCPLTRANAGHVWERAVSYSRWLAARSAIRSGCALANLGIRGLQPECPVRKALESLEPLADIALSRNSTNRRATS